MKPFARWTVLILLSLMSLLPVTAQEQVDFTNPEMLPANMMLDGFTWIHQGVNRCSAAALSIHLSYYQPVTADTYFELSGQVLNTWGADASVRIEEMAAAAEARGLGAVVRRGGTVDLMRQLVAAGFPVLLENSYYDGADYVRDWMSHNRVLVGYDDSSQTFFFQDPLLGFPDGEIVAYSYEDVLIRWKPFNYDYLVIYEPQDEPMVQAILGDQWDTAYNAQWTLDIAQEQINNGENDSFTYFNLGWAQLQLGLNEEAAASFDTALSMGLPMRMLWYEFGPFEAYLAVGRYEDVVTLVGQQLAVAGDEISVEEWYYYAARAYEELGNLERAVLNYQVAIARNRNFTEASERLQALQGGA